MPYRLFGWLHATGHQLLRAERGQGTVEYVGLLLLLGLVFGAVLVAAKDGKDFGLAREITSKIKGAIDKATTLQ